MTATETVDAPNALCGIEIRHVLPSRRSMGESMSTVDSWGVAMCDAEPGSVIVSFPPANPAGQELIEGIRRRQTGTGLQEVTYGESLSERLHASGLSPIETLTAEYHLLHAPEGQEQFVLSALGDLYLEFFARALQRGGITFDAAWSMWFHGQPNFYLHANAVQLADLQFPSCYDDYKRMMGFDGSVTVPTSTAAVTIKIIDTGVDSGAGLTVQTTKNFADSSTGATTEDESGHGTLVTSIIRDLAADAELHVCKVTDSGGRANEWNVLAALAADVAQVDLVNMSLAYGFEDRGCTKCGRSAGSSRSVVCKQILDDLSKLSPRPIVVAAAGNGKADELSYPARFGSALAIGAVTQRGTRASYSNAGSVDHDGVRHENVFVLPGGEDTSSECVAERKRPSSKYFAGTSFAAAFASGLLANVLAKQHEDGVVPDPDKTIQHLRSNADPRFGEAYKNGHGLMKLSYLP
jgi:Subtilase family